MDKTAQMTRNTLIALLLEDEPLIALDLEEELARAGFAVSTLLSCSDAGRWLDEHRPDIVIVDIMLRDGTSANIVTRLISSDIPFIVHSGDHPSMHKDTPFGQGIWVSKPCDTQDIVDAAQTLLSA